MEITAKEIAALLGGEIEGDGNVILTHFAKIEEGKEGSLTFLANPKYTEFIYTSEASAALVNKTFVPEKPIKPTLIRVDDAYKALADLMKKSLTLQKKKKNKISWKSHIASHTKIGKNVSIGAFAVIDEYAEIGDNTVIYPNVYVGKYAKIGSNCIVYPSVSIYQDCIVGNNCIIHANTVIGSDGFGFAPTESGEYEKIPQIGNVVIEDNVEIGSNTSIDRATMGSTLIKKGVKIDNLVQIAHTVVINENSAFAAQCGVAGSAKIGKNCMMGGQVGIVGHLRVGDNVKAYAKTGITSEVEDNATVRGIPSMDGFAYNKAYAIFKKLPDLYRTIYQLEKQVKDLKEGKNE